MQGYCLIEVYIIYLSVLCAHFFMNYNLYSACCVRTFLNLPCTTKYINIFGHNGVSYGQEHVTDLPPSKFQLKA